MGATDNTISTTLYRIVLIVIVFSALYAVLANKLLGVYETVESVSEQKSKNEFALSVSSIRNQWMHNKRSKFKVQLVGSASLTSDEEIFVKVNAKGFVIDVANLSLKQCEALFENLQSLPLKQVNTEEIVIKDEVVGCIFNKNHHLLFKYYFENGIVST